MSKMKSALPVLVQKRYASPNAERALLQISQCVEREGPDLLAIDRFKDLHKPLLVALTVYGREQDRRRSSQAGSEAHLLKPAGYADLNRVLARAAGGES